MRRKKIYGILILTLAIVFVMALATSAFAGGYRPFGNELLKLYVGAAGEAQGKGTNQYGPPNGPAGSRSPHGNFSTSTNFCKTCHAVHLAGEPGFLPGTTDPRGDAWRLLRASSAQDECFFCHEPAGAHTVLVQYTLKNRNSLTPAEFGLDPVVNNLAFGQHTIGATMVPDSNIDGDGGNDSRVPGGQGLTCNTCHSVHGANTLLGDPNAGVWQFKILRKDPAQNNGSATNGIRDIDGPNGGKPYSATPINSDTVLIGFCGDCHNLNVNWITDARTDTRLNPHSHPMNTDGLIDIDGDTVLEPATETVSGPPVNNCKSCHAAKTTAEGGPSNFPHQSVSHKLLTEAYRPPAPYALDPATDITNPQRQLPALDMVCLGCHGGFVGITF